VGAASADLHPSDGGAALVTGLSGATVNAEEVLVLPFVSPAVHVIPHAGTAMLQGLSEYLPYGCR